MQAHELFFFSYKPVAQYWRQQPNGGCAIQPPTVETTQFVSQSPVKASVAFSVTERSASIVGKQKKYIGLYDEWRSQRWAKQSPSVNIDP